MRATRPLRALWLCSDLASKDGWGSYALGLAEALIKRGVQLRILTNRHATDAVPGAAEVIPCLTGPLAPLDRPLAVLWNTGQVLHRAGGCDLVHAIVEPYALGVGNLLRLPYLVTLHGTYAVAPFRESVFTRRLFAGALRRAHRVVCVSQYTKRRLLERVQLDNVSVIPNGVRLDPAAPPAAPDGREPLLLGVGAVKQRKGYHVAIDAVARLAPRYQGLRYAIVGDLSDRRYVAELRNQIQERQLANHVELMGVVSDEELRSLYKSANVFILTSVNSGVAFEGFGLAYLEAGAHGLPVVGSLECGAEDAIRDGVTGFLVAQNDAEAVANRIDRLLSQDGLARQMGEQGRALAQSFTWERVADSYEELYRNAVGR